MARRKPKVLQHLSTVVIEKALSPDQFVVLIARHERRVRSFIASLSLCRSDVVDEVLQSTYLVAWQKLAAFTYLDPSPDEELVRWMCTIARFNLLAYQRQESALRPPLDAKIMERIADTYLEEADYLEARHDALKKCLERLPSRQRELLSLRYWRGLSLEELARRRGQQASAVYMAMSRVRKALEACIRRTLSQEGLAP
ncbi:MAG: sigma-70 family RNA polymerase sigma factor [Pirellulales bacterium]|nr:sigma-70 family RNA polymerase sigma factor [Pirellulales bacterium]